MKTYISKISRISRSVWFPALCIVVLFHGEVLSQDLSGGDSTSVDSTGVEKFGWLAYPYVFLSPETNLAFGLGGIVYFRFSQDTTIKPSSITPSGYYSINDQYDITIIPEFYLGKKFYIYSYVSTGKYIDKYYGMGPQSPEIDNPEYEHRTTIVQLNLQPQISDNIRAGLYSRILNRSISDPLTNPFLLSGDVTGGSGGTSIGLGTVVAIDTRNHRFYPTSGILNEVRAVFYSKAWGSDFDYNKYEIDLRGYSALDSASQHILGLQLYSVFTTSGTPFYDVAMLGGKTIMRGFYLGRYRDLGLVAGQVEYRMKLFWRLGGVVFLGAGEVMPSIRDFHLREMQYAYGFGLRFQFDVVEKIDIRADFGFGKGTSGVYFDVQQAF